MSRNSIFSHFLLFSISNLIYSAFNLEFLILMGFLYSFVFQKTAYTKNSMDQQEIKSAVNEQASQESVEKDVVLNIPEELVPSTSSSTTDRVVTCK